MDRRPVSGVRRGKSAGGFTLVELILVMIIMVTILAFIAPTLGRTFKQRGLDQEAVRMLALTEYARNEAMSQGIPTQVWIDPAHGSYGAEAMPGYTDRTVNAKQYALPQDVHFELAKSVGALTAEGYTQVIEFDPDGAPTVSTGIDFIHILDNDGGSAQLSLTSDGWGYEVTKGAK